MKEWWLSLSSEEKQTTLLGTLVAAILLIYALIWSPLSNKVDALRDKIHHNQALLSWMQQSDKKIELLEKSQQPSSRNANLSLLNIIQTESNQTAFANNISQLQQAENDSVDLRLQKVSFDALIKWIIDLCSKEKLVITQLSATPGTTPGIVDAEIKLQFDNH